MRKGVRKTERLSLEGGEGEGTHEKQKGREDSAVRRWKGEGTREKPKGREESAVRRWEWEPKRKKQKGRKSRGSDRGFLRVFSLEGLDLGFKL